MQLLQSRSFKVLAYFTISMEIFRKIPKILDEDGCLRKIKLFFFFIVINDILNTSLLLNTSIFDSTSHIIVFLTNFLSYSTNTISSDEFLLEAGFLAILVAPLLPGRKKGSRGSPSDTVSFWLVKWFLFRFLLTVGLTKFISGCPKWWSLSGNSLNIF